MPVSTANPDLLMMRESPCDLSERGCGAKPGEPCLTGSGRIALFPHRARVKAHAAKRWGTGADGARDDG